MLNLKVYNGRQLQTFLALLNQCEAEGVTDIRFVRQRISEFIANDLRKEKVQYNKRISRKQQRQLKKPIINTSGPWVCPSCHVGRLTPVKNDLGLHIMGCAKCRYSEIVN